MLIKKSKKGYSFAHRLRNFTFYRALSILGLAERPEKNRSLSHRRVLTIIAFAQPMTSQQGATFMFVYLEVFNDYLLYHGILNKYNVKIYSSFNSVNFVIKLLRTVLISWNKKRRFFLIIFEKRKMCENWKFIKEHLEIRNIFSILYLKCYKW